MTKETKKDITDKQKEIIHLLYSFRFLNSKQIQQLMHHKSPSLIFDWLTDLVAKEYIGRDYNEKAGENKIPAVFWLTKKGLKYIKNRGIQNAYLKRLLHAEKTSFITKDHCLLVADIYLLIRDKVQDFKTQADLANSTDIDIITPDAYYVYKLPNKTRSYFLEVDRETETKAAMKRKFERYVDYYNTYKWKKLTESFFPCITIVSLTQKRSEELKNIVEKIVQNYSLPIIFKFTTYEALLSYGVDEPICFVPFEEKKLYPLL